ncbi:MAG: tetratricopeptide repeat protein [Pseudomonadota bacterium]
MRVFPVFGMAALAAFSIPACGGAKQSQLAPRPIEEIAKEAPPPPPAAPAAAGAAPAAVAAAPKIERTVTKEAQTDFAEAVSYYEEQQKVGLTAETCVAAAQKFREVASAHQKMIEAYFNAGVVFEKCGDARNAESMYQKALAINGSFAPALANLGGLYLRGGNEDMAFRYVEQAKKVDPGHAVASLNMAAIYYSRMLATKDAKVRKDYEEKAFTELSRVLAVDSDNIEAYTLMALLYFEGAEENKARLEMARLLAYEEGKRRNEKYAPLHNVGGLLYLKKGNVSKAAELFRQAIEVNPGYVDARMNLGQVVLGFRKYDEAEGHFRRVLEDKSITASTRYDALVGLGVALRGQKKTEEAARAYEEATRLQSDRGEAFFDLALLWKDAKFDDMKTTRQAYGRAKEQFNQFLTKKGTPESKRKDAQTYITDCDKAIEALDQAIAAMAEMPPPAPTPAPAPAPTPTPAPTASPGTATGQSAMPAQPQPQPQPEAQPESKQGQLQPQPSPAGAPETAAVSRPASEAGLAFPVAVSR